jgi:hypothetical protein
MTDQPASSHDWADHPSTGPRTAFTEVFVAEGQDAARTALRERRGSLAVIVRDTPRAALFDCPCGCGDVVVINTDPRSGPAWRIRVDETGATLMPSVWRTTGCRSHFIVWQSRIWWCRFLGDDSQEDETGAGFRSETEEGGVAADQDDWPEAMDAELRSEWRRIRQQWRGRSTQG